MWPWKVDGGPVDGPNLCIYAALVDLRKEREGGAEGGREGLRKDGRMEEKEGMKFEGI